MNVSLNGAKPLSQQAIMIFGVENTGKELLSIAPDLERPHFNNAVFKELDLDTPAPSGIELSSSKLPVGKKLIWMGIIYADSVLTSAIAYR